MIFLLNLKSLFFLCFFGNTSGLVRRLTYWAVLALIALPAMGDTNSPTNSKLPAPLNWRPFELVEAASWIVVGDVGQVVDLPNTSSFRLFKVRVQSILKGAEKPEFLYVIENPPSDSRHSFPAALFPCRYLLFLQEPASKHAPLLSSLAHQLNVEPRQIVSTVAGWKGAVSLDSKWQEQSNKVLRTKWGELSEENLLSATREFVEWFSFKDQDLRRRKLEVFRQKKGLFEDFAASARAQTESPPSAPKQSP